MQIFKHPNYDFLRWRWHALALSWIVIISGLIFIWTKGLPRGVEFAGALSQTKDTVVQALKQANLGNFTVVGTEIVGPIVGRELTQKGVLATLLSLGGILLYI